jgi:hypothetical protein
MTSGGSEMNGFWYETDGGEGALYGLVGLVLIESAGYTFASPAHEARETRLRVIIHEIGTQSLFLINSSMAVSRRGLPSDAIPISWGVVSSARIHHMGRHIDHRFRVGSCDGQQDSSSMSCC